VPSDAGEQYAPVLAGKKTRTNNGVGLFLQEYPDHVEEIQGMISRSASVDDRSSMLRAVVAVMDRGQPCHDWLVIDEDQFNLPLAAADFFPPR